VVDLHGVKHVFAVAVPRNGQTFGEQAQDALETIRRINEQYRTQRSILSQTVFLRDIAMIEPCRQIMREFYGDELPATTYVPQQPCNGKLLAIEAWGEGCGCEDVEIQRVSEHLVKVVHSGVSWTHVAHVAPRIDLPHTYDRSHDALGRMGELLTQAGTRLDRVIRTWLYLGDITGPEDDTQRYKELNRARSDFFEDIPFSADRKFPSFDKIVFPASTGIGTDSRDVLMSCLALDTARSDCFVLPLENPLQVPAFDYAAAYSPRSPKFSRAIAIVVGSHATIFVSGTASIVQSESRFLDDVESQTRQTLDNIAMLIGEANFRRYGVSGHGAFLGDLASIRVYVKRPEDFAKVKAVCEDRLGGVPAVYVVANVCRPELLVEIEGVAISHASER
jgi:enamine deaminase RidA (YjgF/YER057c/UK114 family)